MEDPKIECPVCTLYLRSGITLKNHLSSHPKQKVIEALCRVTQDVQPNTNIQQKIMGINQTDPQTGNMAIMSPINTLNTNFTQINPMNQAFIYQQFMSSSGTPSIMNVNPINQQFVTVPTVFNSQMMCSPYMFQQQQQVQFMSTATNIQPLRRSRSQQILPRPLSNPAICEPPINLTEIQFENTYEAGTSNTLKQESLRDVSETCTVSTATDNLENLTVNDNNHRILSSDYDEEDDDNICNDVPLEQHKQNDSEPDIIIERNGGEVVSVTITNVGSSSNNKDDENVDEIEEENHLSTSCHTTRIQTVKKEVSNELNEVIIVSNQDSFEEMNTGNLTLSRQENNDIMIASSSNIDSNNITVLEMSDVGFILPDNFIPTGQSLITKVNDVNETNDDRPQDLMSIGEENNKNIKYVIEDKLIFNVENYEEVKLDDESLSRESLNIRADERMPPRGELSEQESNGASEIGWGSRIYQEGSSGMSISYDLLARESWEGSDCSDSEMPPLQSRIPPTPSDYKSDVDDPDESSTKPLIFNYNCATCGASFRCPKERRVHQANEHQTGSSSSVIEKKKTIRKRPIRKISRKAKLSEEDSKDNIIPKNEIENLSEIESKPDVKTEIKFDVDQIDNILCSTCGKLFSTKREWNIHNKKMHGVKIPSANLVCAKCDVTFSQPDLFAEHLKVHPLECNICYKTFYKIQNLKIHLRRHTGIRPFKCELCTKDFFSKQKLTEHMNVHTGNKPIKCSMCPQTFKRYSNLAQHRNYHHLNIKKKVKDYICHCGEIFHSKSKLQWHKETHEAKPKGCKYCNEKFIHMASLTRHIRRIHNQRYVPDESRENENVECELCKGIYLNKSLQAHMLTHTDKKQHVCTICNKVFSTKWNLKLHKWTHASPTSKPYKCEVCQAGYIRQSDYISHMNSHKSLRPYTCNYCGCKFIRKYNCIRHVREHEEGKNFTCSICNKSFYRSYYLKEHMRVHSGARPYSCHICGKTSTTKSNHNKHIKIHHAREPVMTEG